MMLPPELWDLIFQMVDEPETLFCLMLSCKIFHQLIESSNHQTHAFVNKRILQNIHSLNQIKDIHPMNQKIIKWINVDSSLPNIRIGYRPYKFLLQHGSNIFHLFDAMGIGWMSYFDVHYINQIHTIVIHYAEEVIDDCYYMSILVQLYPDSIKISQASTFGQYHRELKSKKTCHLCAEFFTNLDEVHLPKIY